VRLPRAEFIGTKELQQDTQALLRNVFRQEPGWCIATRRMVPWSMEETQKPKTLDEHGLIVRAGEQFLKQFIGPGVHRRGFQIREQAGNGRKFMKAIRNGENS